MRVCIVGIDGYLGWSLACYLAERGHSISGIDAFYRRKWVAEVGGMSITPIADMDERWKAHNEKWPDSFEDMLTIDISKDYKALLMFLEIQQPDAIVHLGEQPSAPFSMIDVDHAVLTQHNNVIGTLRLLFAIKDVCPDAHLLKLGTLGEMGTPEIPICEGNFQDGSIIIYPDGKNFRLDGLMFPRNGGSLYHNSKIQDTVNVKKACDWWNLRSTDIMQGVVYGTDIDEFEGDKRLITRFDCCEYFGTVMNRFIAQAIIGRPLTLYGKGHQKRGLIPLRDSMQCMTLLLENAPAPGEYRTVNQLENVYDLTELALKVQQAGESLDLDVTIKNYTDPRVEREDHTYEVIHDTLSDLGYRPTRDMEIEIRSIFETLMPFRDRILAVGSSLHPKTRWSGEHRECEEIRSDQFKV